MSQDSVNPENQFFTRETIIKSVATALMNVSKDLYNLGLDDMSNIALTMGEQCLNHIGADRNELVHPREPNTPPPGQQVAPQSAPQGSVTCTIETKDDGCGCGCAEKEVNCNGHTNRGVDTGPKTSAPPMPQPDGAAIEKEVSEIVTKIRSESKGQ